MLHQRPLKNCASKQSPYRSCHPVGGSFSYNYTAVKLAARLDAYFDGIVALRLVAQGVSLLGLAPFTSYLSPASSHASYVLWLGIQLLISRPSLGRESTPVLFTSWRGQLRNLSSPFPNQICQAHLPPNPCSLNYCPYATARSMACLLRTRYRALSPLYNSPVNYASVSCLQRPTSSPIRFYSSRIMPSTAPDVTPQYAYIEDAEKLQYYSPGGLHPVTIGDQLASRYTVVHKLGFGTFSTTWLARDTQRGVYVAVKIARADSNADEVCNLGKLNNARTSITGSLRHAETVAQDAETLIPPLLDTFTIEGPNGKHPCYVTEPAACSLSDSKGGAQGGLFRLEVARALAAQVACAVELVHSCGLVHGGQHLPFSG